MKKFWRVLVHEYARQVFRGRFLVVLVSLPAGLGLVFLIALLAVRLSYDSQPVGYVDQSGLLVVTRLPKRQADSLLPEIELRRFSDEAAARNALEMNQIRGYYVLEKDFQQTGKARLVAEKPLARDARDQFNRLLRLNLSSGQPSAVLNRLLEGDDVNVRMLDGAKEMGSDGWVRILLPLLAGVLFILVVNTSGGYLLQAVVEEKENRTMEIIVTSVSPVQLMAGKIIGNLSVGLTQLLAWAGLPGVGLALLVNALAPASASKEWNDILLLMLLVLLPSFILISAVMAVIGASAIETREAQQIAGLFTLPSMLPFFFSSSIIANPNGPLALGLSFFPLTSAVVLPLRAALTPLPFWEITLNLLLLNGCAVGALWLAGRSFRLGMLRYGKPLSLRELLSRRPPANQGEQTQ